MAKELLVPSSDEVPAGDAEDHDGRGREPDEQDVDVRPDAEAVGEELPHARQLGAVVGDGRADGPLHPGVGAMMKNAESQEARAKIQIVAR